MATLIHLMILAQETRFHSEPDRDLNLFIYVFLALVLAAVGWWRVMRFEKGLENESKTPREAYNGFLVGVAAALVVCLGIGIAVNFFSVRSLFLGG